MLTWELVQKEHLPCQQKLVLELVGDRVFLVKTPGQDLITGNRAAGDLQRHDLVLAL